MTVRGACCAARVGTNRIAATITMCAITDHAVIAVNRSEGRDRATMMAVTSFTVHQEVA